MKRLKLCLGLLIIMFAIVEYSAVSIKAQTDAEQEQCPTDYDHIYNVRFSSDGQYLAATWQLNSVRVWNSKTGEVVSVLANKLMSEEEKIAFSPDGKYVITGGNHSDVMLWDTVTGNRIRTFDRRENISEDETVWEHIQSFTFSPDGKSIAILDETAGVLWDVETGARLSEFPLTNLGNPDVVFSPNGTTILIEDRIWDVQTHELLYEGDMGDITDFSPDGKYILSIKIPSHEGKLILIDAVSYQIVRTLTAFDDERPNDWQFSPDGKYLFATKTDGLIRIWEVETGKLLHELEAATQYGVRPTFLNNQSILMPKAITQTNQDQTILLIYDIKTGNQLYQTVIDVPIYEWTSFAATAPDGKSIAVSHFAQPPQSILASWDIQTGKQIRQYC